MNTEPKKVGGTSSASPQSSPTTAAPSRATRRNTWLIFVVVPVTLFFAAVATYDERFRDAMFSWPFAKDLLGIIAFGFVIYWIFRLVNWLKDRPMR